MENRPIKTFDRLDYAYKLMVVCALGITAVILLRDIVIPFVFAVIISIAILPLVKKLEKRIGKIFAILVALLATITIVVSVVWLLTSQGIRLIAEMPGLEARFMLMVHRISVELNSIFGFSDEEQMNMTRDFVTGLSSFIGSFLISTTGVFSVVVQIPIYTFLILIYRNKLAEFFVQSFPNSNEILRTESSRVIQGYISGQLLVILLIVILDTIGLMVIGIEYAFFFGLVSGLMTIIPYIGNFIGGALPVVMALITKDSAWYAVAIVGWYAVVHFIEGNIIAPRIMGSKVSVNALTAILGLLIGGKILGIAGMIMAVPVIGMLRIILNFSEHLKPYGVLMEDNHKKKNKEKDSITHPPDEEIKSSQ